MPRGLYCLALLLGACTPDLELRTCYEDDPCADGGGAAGDAAGDARLVPPGRDAGPGRDGGPTRDAGPVRDAGPTRDAAPPRDARPPSRDAEQGPDSAPPLDPLESIVDVYLQVFADAPGAVGVCDVEARCGGSDVRIRNWSSDVGIGWEWEPTSSQCSAAAEESTVSIGPGETFWVSFEGDLRTCTLTVRLRADGATTGFELRACRFDSDDCPGRWRGEGEAEIVVRVPR